MEKTYKILEVTSKEDTLITKVEYTFDGKKVVIDIPHFAPSSKEEITVNIENRAISEENKINAKEKIGDIIGDIELEIGQPVEIIL